MSSHFNPMASMSGVPRSRPVKNGVVGEERPYYSDDGFSNDFMFQSFQSSLQPSFNQQNVFSDINSMPSVDPTSTFDASIAIQMAEQAALEKEAEMDLKMERESPEILSAFQGPAPSYKYEDLEASTGEVHFSNNLNKIEAQPIGKPTVFGFFDTSNKIEAQENTSQEQNESVLVNSNFSEESKPSKIQEELNLLKKECSILRESLNNLIKSHNSLLDYIYNKKGQNYNLGEILKNKKK